MTLRNLFLCAIIGGTALVTSCSSTSDDDALVATQVADGTIPPWFAESDGGGYTDVTQSPATTYTAPSRKATSSTAKTTTKKSTAKKSAPKARTYTVKKGDALERIARRHGVKTSALKKANNLKSDLIRPGQKLRIP